MGEDVVNPFVDDPPEVPLDPDPLLTVLTQVRFPPVLQLGDESLIRKFQEAFKAEYPVSDREQTVEILITPQSQGPIAQPKGEDLWKFRSRDRSWQVSLSKTFVALETTDYTSRKDYCDRLSRVLEVTKAIADPVECSRIGTRYVDRVDNGHLLANLAAYIRPEILNAQALPLQDDVKLVHSLCESRFDLGEAMIQTRWGRLPAGAVVDPAIPATGEPSWIFDFDMFSVSPTDFDLQALLEVNWRFAARAYAFFRWAVNEDFLRRFGGNI